MEKFVSMVDGEYRKGHFPGVWGPGNPQRPCLLSPRSNATSKPTISIAPAAPNVHTISGLQEALKMLGCRIAVDGDYGPETRHAVMNFQMHSGIVADGIAGVQTEAKLLTELSNPSRSGDHLPESLLTAQPLQGHCKPSWPLLDLRIDLFKTPREPTDST
jgi:hypothetical protein